MKSFVIILFSLIIVSCTTIKWPPVDPSLVETMEIKRLQVLDTDSLCYAYSENNKSNKVKAELDRRNLLSEKDFKLIDSKKVSVGMSECALIIGFKEKCNARMSATDNDGNVLARIWGCSRDLTFTESLSEPRLVDVESSLGKIKSISKSGSFGIGSFKEIEIK